MCDVYIGVHKGKWPEGGWVPAGASFNLKNKMDTLECFNYDEESERVMILTWLIPDWFTSIKTLE